MFEIKVVCCRGQSDPVLPSLALLLLPPLLTGTATGSLLNPQAFVPSERPYSRGFTRAEFTRRDHRKCTYKQSRRCKNAIASPGRQPVEIRQIGLALAVTEAPHVTRHMYIFLTHRQKNTLRQQCVPLSTLCGRYTFTAKLTEHETYFKGLPFHLTWGKVQRSGA